MEHEKPPFSPYLPLFLGVFAVSTGAIFARAAEAPSLTIAAYRVGLATLLVAPFALFFKGREMASLAKRDVLFVLGAGFFLAIHFGTWIASLAHTTVASSVVLVNTIPIWVGLLTPCITKEKLSKWTLRGILASVVGGIVVGGGDFAASGSALWGDFLALCGAWSAAGYVLLGRNVRSRLSILSYAFLCYGTAAACLWIGVLLSGTAFTGFTPTTWGMFFGMALIPQILGHGSYNWALRWLSAGFISVALLGEPIVSPLLAWGLLGEAITPIKTVGASIILAGIFLAARGE